MIFILILLCFLIPLDSLPVTINYSDYECDNSSTHLVSSSFETNLNNLLSTLVSNITTTKNGFLIKKQATQDQNFSYYGLALCRGDVDPSDCSDCIQMASKGVRQNCNGDRAILWMEKCMLRYSNNSLFSKLQEDPFIRKYNKNYIKQANVQNWTKLLQNTLGDVINNAASASMNISGKKYATKEAWFAPMNKYLYTLAQCTPDLTVNNCSKCLSVANTEFYTIFTEGGIVLSPSCTLRYELYQFYDILNLTQSPPVSPPNTNTSISQPSTGKHKSSSIKVVVAIIVPLAIVGMLIALCICLYRRKAMKYRSQEVKNVLGDLTTAESLMFELGTLEAATNNFSDDQKLGQGGFGSVYKFIL